jgi:hypothetical protein
MQTTRSFDWREPRGRGAMKGFTIILTPKDQSGVERNKEFLENYKAQGLPAGGKVEAGENNMVRCVWDFKMFIPDKFKKKLIAGYTKELDKIKREKDNFDYRIEFK